MYIKKIISTLVFIVIFSTVSPAQIFAGDIFENINIVRTSSNTGGQSGTSGLDGVNGKNGQSGASSVSLIQGKSNATISIESSINGEKIVDIYETNVSNNTSTDSSTITETESVNNVLSSSSIDNFLTDETSDVSVIMKVLSSINLILFKYVSFLF